MSLEEHHKFILQTMQRNDDIARKFISELEAENARLKADAQLVVKHLGEACADNLRLKAEVERLKAIVGADAIDREHGMCCDSSSENARLKADVNELADGLKLASEVGIKIADEVTRLKAENARLKEEVEYWKKGCER